MPNMMSRLNQPQDVRSIIGQFQQNAQSQAQNPGPGENRFYRGKGGLEETSAMPVHGFSRGMDSGGYLGRSGGSSGPGSMSGGFNFEDFLMELEKKRRGQDLSSMLGMNYG